MNNLAIFRSLFTVLNLARAKSWTFRVDPCPHAGRQDAVCDTVWGLSETCSDGAYLAWETPRGNNVCESCAVGTYMSIGIGYDGGWSRRRSGHMSPACNKCPNGTSTAGRGTWHVEQCISYPEGTFANTYGDDGYIYAPSEQSIYPAGVYLWQYMGGNYLRGKVLDMCIRFHACNGTDNRSVECIECQDKVLQMAVEDTHFDLGVARTFSKHVLIDSFTATKEVYYVIGFLFAVVTSLHLRTWI